MKIYFCTTKQFIFHAKERHYSVLFGRPTIHTPQDVCADHKARPRLPACDQLSIPGDACSVRGTPRTVVVSHHGPLTPRLLGPDREPRGGAHAHRHVLVATAHAAQVRDGFLAQTIGLLPHALSKNCAMMRILTSVAHPMAAARVPPSPLRATAALPAACAEKFPAKLRHCTQRGPL